MRLLPGYVLSGWKHLVPSDKNGAIFIIKSNNCSSWYGGFRGSEEPRGEKRKQHSWIPSLRKPPWSKSSSQKVWVKLCSANLSAPAWFQNVRNCKKNVFQCFGRCSLSPYVMPLQCKSQDSQESGCKCGWQWPRASLTFQMEQGTFTF